MTTDVTDVGVGAIRTGLLGGGFMARVHSAAIRAAGAQVLSVASSSPEASRAAADQLGIPRAEASAASLLAHDAIDVVHICTPNATHAELASAAIAAGRHVVCEKPLATSVADALRLTEAAQLAGVIGAVPFVYRYHPMVREARARVLRGDAGVLLSVDAAYLQDWLLQPEDANWRAGSAAGGPSRAFADIGSHLCDLVEFVTGEPIIRLTAITRRVYETRGGSEVTNEDIAALLVELRSGAVGTLLISQMAAGRKNALVLEIHGTEQALKFEQERPEELWIGDREGSRLLLRDPATASADSMRVQNLPAGHPMGYQDAFNAFVADVHAAVRGAHPEGLPMFADGLRAAILTEAVLLSASTRTWVEVSA